MKNKKKTILAVAALGMALAVTIGGTLAYFTDADSASNSLVMGKVDITLEEPVFTEATDETYTMNHILPNQTIVKDPTVTVAADSETCYLRVKIEIQGLEDLTDTDGNSYSQKLLDALRIQSEDGTYETMAAAGWTYQSSDGYFYWKSQQKAGSSVKVFDQFTIPEEWGNEVSNRSISIAITAQAVQAEGFEADQNGDGIIDSWSDTSGDEIVVEKYSVSE